MKFTPPFLGHLAERATRLLDGETTPWQDSMQQKGKALFNTAVHKLDGVTREELDDHMEVLRHTRVMLERLTDRVEQLEAQLSMTEHRTDDS